MGKQKKHLLILIILLIVLVAGYFGLREYNKRKTAEDSKKNTVRIFNNSEIETFTYAYADSSFTLEKRDGNWVYTEDPSLQLDNNKINAMLSLAGNVPVTDVVEGVADFEQYGLEEPYLTITCSDGKKDYQIRMGDYSMTISKYFIRINNEDKVYTTDNSLYSTFVTSVETLQKKED